MKTYNINFERVTTETIEVTARSKAEARDIATRHLFDGEDFPRDIVFNRGETDESSCDFQSCTIGLSNKNLWTKEDTEKYYNTI